MSMFLGHWCLVPHVFSFVIHCVCKCVSAQALMRALNHVLQEFASCSLASLKPSVELLATGPDSVRGIELPPFRDRYMLKTVS